MLSVLITGASRGIGKAIALTFASKGYYTFINAHTSLEALEETAQEIRKQGGQVHCVPGDVSKPSEVAHIFEQIYAVTDALSVLINNAGIQHFGLLSALSEETWETMIQTNLSSAFYCTKASLNPMIQKKQGRILNISSVWGIAGASCEVAYSTAKAGLNGFTKALAKELAPSRIQVNALACGVIDTAMTNALSKEEQEALTEAIPASRFGTPEEVARIAYDIVHGPDYLTGQVIAVDGGFL